MNRQQRRLAEKVVRKGGAGAQMQQAVQALQQVAQAGDIPKIVKDLQDQLAESHRITDALVGDYETLAREMEVREETFIRTLARFLAQPEYEPLPEVDKLKLVKAAYDEERTKIMDRRMKQGV